MAGINLDVNSGGIVTDCSFDDSQVSGGSGSSLDNDGEIRNTVVYLPGVNSTGLTGAFHYATVTAGDLTLSGTADWTHTDANLDTLTISANQASLNGGSYTLSPSTGENGITISGHSVGVIGSRVVLGTPGASNNADAIRISGNYALVDSVRFTNALSATWRYLVSLTTGSTGTVIGTYSFSTNLIGTGELST